MNHINIMVIFVYIYRLYQGCLQDTRTDQCKQHNAYNHTCDPEQPLLSIGRWNVPLTDGSDSLYNKLPCIDLQIPSVVVLNVVVEE